MVRAALGQAQSARAAESIWHDAQALVTAPRDLDVKVAGAEATLQVAGEQLKAAQAAATAADLEQALWGRVAKSLEEGFDVTLPTPGNPTVHLDAKPEQLGQARLQWNLTSQKTWQAHAQVGIATSAVETARQALSDLRAQKADPQSLQAQANAAESAFHIAEAAVLTAQANLEVVLSGIQPEQITAAEALAAQAREAVQSAQVRRDQARITAPGAGVVTAVVQRPGEVAAAGSPIVRLADLSQVMLTVYVQEPDLGRVRLDQPARVTVDSFPGRLFPGTVTEIADQAEFTPKNTETRQDRINTVFAVTITLANPDGALKPGMPADAVFCAAGAVGCGDSGLGPASSSAGDRSLPTSAAELVGTPPVPAGALRASGTVNGAETSISSELTGRIVEVVSEGDHISAGQILVRLDGSDLDPNYRQALAAADAARADLARVTAEPQAAARRPSPGSGGPGRRQPGRDAFQPGRCAQGACQSAGPGRSNQ